MFQLSDRVSIIGGVLQEYGVRLDGLTGIVTSSRHDAPPGTFAVYVYWDQSPYRDRIQELPKWVNVPPQFLCRIEDESTSAPEDDSPDDSPQPSPQPSRGGLWLVR